MFKKLLENIFEVEANDGKKTTLTNRDKLEIRRALFDQVESILLLMGEKYSGVSDELRKLSPEVVAEYCYRIIGLYPAGRE